MDYSIRIGGEAGQGIQTVAETLARVFARSGYQVFTHQDYESRIRGGHNYFQLRLADHPLSASRHPLNLVIALDAASLQEDRLELQEDGLILYDSQALKRKEEGTRFVDIPLQQLAVDKGGNKIMAGVAAVGAAMGLLGLPLEALSPILAAQFAKKGDDVVLANLRVAQAGYEYAGKASPRGPFSLIEKGKARILIDGSQAIALGALAADCRFYSGYPMTPSTGIMQFLAARQEAYPLVVEQAEDEIAAINMALGASYSGVRAMTGTSGGGFALMVEGLSLAAMTETPLVIVLAQRPGPATGLPTRTEQADLEFALYSAHGEFPRVLLAPGSPLQAFQLTQKAFDLSEKYQVPAIILSDQYLADCQWTYDDLPLAEGAPRDHRLHEPSLDQSSGYKRYAYHDSGVSLLAIPGEGIGLVVVDSDEHDEEGHLVEDAETRVRMVNKRLFQKWAALRQEIGPPLHVGDPQPEVVLLGWGSMYGSLREVVDLLREKTRIALLHFSELWPFPDLERLGMLKMLRRANQIIAVEGNATGQFSRLFQRETGIAPHILIPRYDGRPYTVEDLKGKIDAYLE